MMTWCELVVARVVVWDSYIYRRHKLINYSEYNVHCRHRQETKDLLSIYCTGVLRITFTVTGHKQQ
jgi:hypothetical protein